jgi:hypothetical protein
MPMLPQAAIRTPVSKTPIYLFAGFLIALFLLHGPALITPWWYMDDYNHYDPEYGIWQTLRGGWRTARLLLGIWLAPIQWDAPPDSNGWNLLFRWLLLALHAANATLIARLLWKRIGPSSAILSSLLFVLWPFQGQAVLWLSAAIYPIGTTLSLLGLIFILQGTPSKRSAPAKCLAGAALIAAAAQTNQAVAVAAPLLFLLLLALDLLLGERLSPKQVIRQLLWLSLPLAASGLLSTLIMRLTGLSRLYDSSLIERIQFATTEALNVLYQLPLYSSFNATLNLLLTLAYLACLCWSLYHRFMRFPAFIGLAILPLLIAFGALAPVIASGSTWPSLRILHLLPLAFSSMAAVGFLLSRQCPPLRMLLTVLCLALPLSGIPNARKLASEYVALYQAEKTVFAQIEAAAASHGTSKVAFMDWSRSGPWRENPFSLASLYGDNLRTILHIDWGNWRAAYSMTQLQPIPPEEAESLRHQSHATALMLPHDDPFRFLFLPTHDTLLVVPR